SMFRAWVAAIHSTLGRGSIYLGIVYLAIVGRRIAGISGTSPYISQGVFRKPLERRRQKRRFIDAAE
ncbi:MAG: hypothetical protein WCD52_28020, partial [Xanthobacteraceae bacterium]